MQFIISSRVCASVRGTAATRVSGMGGNPAERFSSPAKWVHSAWTVELKLIRKKASNGGGLLPPSPPPPDPPLTYS